MVERLYKGVALVYTLLALAAVYVAVFLSMALRQPIQPSSTGTENAHIIVRNYGD